MFETEEKYRKSVELLKNDSHPTRYHIVDVQQVAIQISFYATVSKFYVFKYFGQERGGGQRDCQLFIVVTTVSDWLAAPSS